MVTVSLLTLMLLTAADRPPALRDVDIAQRLDQQVPLSLQFRDETGRTVRLGDYFGRRPVVLSLAYFRCPMLCTEVLNDLTGSLKGMSLTAGRDFEVLTVSFDPRDTPAAAAAKRDIYLRRYGRAAAGGWHFLTGDEAAIKALTSAVGFRYVYDPQSQQFAHASGIMVLTPEGRISRYFYGIEYAPRDLRLSLVEASAGRIGSPIDRVLLFCFHYDAATGRYGPAILGSIRVGAMLTLLVLVAFIFMHLRRDLRRAHPRRSGRPHLELVKG